MGRITEIAEEVCRLIRDYNTYRDKFMNDETLTDEEKDIRLTATGKDYILEIGAADAMVREEFENDPASVASFHDFIYEVEHNPKNWETSLEDLRKRDRS